MNYTPEQARDWCYEVRVKPMPISSAIPIMQSLADQVERLTDDNIRLRTAQSLLRPVVASKGPFTSEEITRGAAVLASLKEPPTVCKHTEQRRIPYSLTYVCRSCGVVTRDDDTLLSNRDRKP